MGNSARTRCMGRGGAHKIPYTTACGSVLERNWPSQTENVVLWSLGVGARGGQVGARGVRGSTGCRGLWGGGGAEGHGRASTEDT